MFQRTFGTVSSETSSCDENTMTRRSAANRAVGAGAASGRERQVARERLRVAPEGRDAVALPAGSGVATDAEERLIGGAGSTWQDDLHFAER